MLQFLYEFTYDKGSGRGLVYMADAIGAVLANRKSEEPGEIDIIKTYVHAHFQAVPSVTLQQQTIVIGVHSSALAGALRPHLHELREACQTDKKLIIRIQQ